MATNKHINGSDYFRIRRTIGHQLVDGKKKPIYKYFYGTSERDAKNKYKAYLQEQERLKYEKQYMLDTATLNMRAEEYISSVLAVSAKYASGTKDRYASSYRVHVEGSWLDKMSVKDIKSADIQSFYNDLDVTMSTLKQVNRFLAALYKWMVKCDYATDVISAVELPQKPENKKSEEIIIWDDRTWVRLTSQNFAFRHDFLIKLMCYSGMRIGECLGLKYGDIRDGTIHVVRQYTNGELKDPKYNSKREIPMHPKLVDALSKHKAWHEEEMRKKGYKTDYIFTTNSGRLIDVTNLYRAFGRFYKKVGIEVQTFHVYRHTFCTKLCEAGVPLEVAAKLLGHKNLEVTAAHYALIRHDTKKDAIALLK